MPFCSNSDKRAIEGDICIVSDCDTNSRLRVYLRRFAVHMLDSIDVELSGNSAHVAIGIGAYMVIFTLNYTMGGNPIPHKSQQLFHIQQHKILFQESSFGNHGAVASTQQCLG